MNEFTLLLLFLIMQSSEAKNGLSKESLLRAVKLLHAAKESGILSALRENKPLKSLLSSEKGLEMLAPFIASVVPLFSGERKENPPPKRMEHCDEQLLPPELKRLLGDV